MIKKGMKDENLLLLIYGLMSFTFGLWTNYRQLWLKDIGFETINISNLLSVSLVCSSVIIFIISFFSTKVKLKNITLLSIILRSIAFIDLIFSKNNLSIKAAMLLCIMCENMFALCFYPLLSEVNDSNDIYKKHVLVNYFAKDSATILCAFLLGVSIGKFMFSYDTCLILSYVFNNLSLIAMLYFNKKCVVIKEEPKSFLKSFISLFDDKTNNLYLVAQFITEISYSLIFGLTMLILTDYLNMDVSIASIFIIVSNILGSQVNGVLGKYSDKFSMNLSIFLKYGLRAIFILIALIINKPIAYIISILLVTICTRILDDKINGIFIRKIDEGKRFLFGNIRYFILCIADSIAIYASGILLTKNYIYVFIATLIFVVFGIISYKVIPYER